MLRRRRNFYWRACDFLRNPKDFLIELDVFDYAMVHVVDMSTLNLYTLALTYIFNLFHTWCALRLYHYI